MIQERFCVIFLTQRITEVRRQWFPLFHYKKLIDLLAAYTSLAETARERSTPKRKRLQNEQQPV